MPFVCRSLSFSTPLKVSHKVFPFLLTGECGQFLHSLFPVKIKRSLHNHEHFVLIDIHLHLQNAYLPDSLSDFGPGIRLVMYLPIACDEGFILLQVQSLTIAFHRLMILSGRITFPSMFHNTIINFGAKIKNAFKQSVKLYGPKIALFRLFTCFDSYF